MPFSRYPSLQSKPAGSLRTDGDQTKGDDRITEPSRRNPDAAILDPDRLPTWQRPFVLGPNVRFTRTPHRKHPESPASAAKPEALDDLPPQSPAAALQNRIAEELPAERGEGTLQHPAAEPFQDEPPVLVDFLFHPLGAQQHDAAQPAFLEPETDPEPVTQTTTQQTSTNNDKSQVNIPQVPAISEMHDAPNAATADETRQAQAGAGALAFIPDGLAFEMMELGLFDDATPAPKAATSAEDDSDDEASACEDLMPCTSASDAVETAADEPTASAEEGASAVALYRQVLLYSPTRRAADDYIEAEPAQAQETPLDASDAIDDNNLTDERDEAFAEIDEDAWEDEAEADIADFGDAQPHQPVPAENDASDNVAGPLNVLAKHEQTDFLFPSIELLQAPLADETSDLSQEVLEQSAGLLESILEDFGVKGEIIDVRPGPVVTLYEFEPAPGVKSSRVINLSDDIARSMSALSARVAVIPGRNVIGIELPNEERETVYLRELLENRLYMTTDFRLPLCLGKNIGGEPVVAELAKMPHLLVAGTTGSGKSVAINTMILSLLYHLRPEECRLIMVDPKMLELSVYDGIPHLLTPVVTDPKKAVLALKWAVREMEDRYRKMSRLGVRNIDGFNKRVAEARTTGETIMVSVPTGFDRTTGEQIFEEQELDLSALPYIVVIVDEMADLMMVAGKEIEGTIQRLAQMARAAGIHLIMATQRPSVDVITGTIKANFPTRISFQVTSKIDSRTILGEQGAEYLLGQGDMLHMKGGGRIARVHGPFVSDHEVEKVVAHLKTQGTPTYLGSVVVDEEEEDEGDEDTAVFDATDMGSEDDDADDLFAKAVKIVQRDKKCSTSYIQRRLSIGYNRAASLVERMEKEGLVGPANHVGKREILDSAAPG
ncbi:DNA translocase FtsK [Martelella mediterranea]|uniref:DNA translocase FtsK n=1 Tax=Martelella mediterranea TaxID=293089 RepID=UPI001E41DFED|nr:DNA translocase FtsK [Martelella mediterranea]